MSNKKTTAKAAGVKSTFSYDGKVYMTSFGNGNAAVLEKKITENEVENIKQDPRAFDIEPEENRKLRLTKGRIPLDGVKSALDRPVNCDKAVSVDGGDEKVSYNQELLKKFFNSPESIKDNLHLQIAYNIIDVDKILSQHVANIIFELNNLLPVDADDTRADDFFEYISTENTFEVFCKPQEHIEDTDLVKKITGSRDLFCKTLGVPNKEDKKDEDKKDEDKKNKGEDNNAKNQRLRAIGDVFIDEADNKTELKAIDDIYYVFAIIGSLRLFVSDYKNDKGYDAWPYNLEKVKNAEKILKVLDSYMERAFAKINSGFLTINSYTFNMLEKIYDLKEPAEKGNMINKYYRFAVLKEYKRFGFSIKKLREAMLDMPALESFKDTLYDTVRQKLNNVLDFILFDYYLQLRKKNSKSKEPLTIVKNLRKTQNEEQKQEYYINEAKEAFTEIEGLLAPLPNLLIPENIKEYNEDPRNKTKYANFIFEHDTTSDYSPFTKLIFLLTQMLDGKSINDLVTGLVNKFDNIGSFNNLLKNGLKAEPDYKDEYKLFANATKITNELQKINNLTRMTMHEYMPKKKVVNNALIALGCSKRGEDLDNETMSLIDIKAKKKETGLRNFITKNVLKSRAYLYITRYVDAQTVPAIAANKNLVDFVLGRMDEKQLIRYYAVLKPEDKEPTAETMRTALAEAVANYSYDRFAEANRGKNNAEEIMQLEREKALTRIYLTVVYLFIKNMVYVNARYVMAYHALERDSEYLGVTVRGKKGKSYNTLTKAYIAESERLLDLHAKELDDYKKGVTDKKPARYHLPLNKHACEYLTKDMQLADEGALRQFRNNAAHYNTVRLLRMNLTGGGTLVQSIGKFNSYFEAYHYFSQVLLLENIYSDSTYDNIALKEKLEDARERGVYCKDAVKALCTPFGYNLPRYKSLTIDGLFDKNDEAGSK